MKEGVGIRPFRGQSWLGRNSLACGGGLLGLGLGLAGLVDERGLHLADGVVLESLEAALAFHLVGGLRCR